MRTVAATRRRATAVLAGTVFAGAVATGCGTGTTGGPTAGTATGTTVSPSPTSSGSRHLLPDDFPLTAGFDQHGGQVEGPTHGDLGVLPLDICGDFRWKLPKDRIDTWLSAGERSETRELVLFGSPKLATRELGRLRTQAESCHEQTFVDRSGAVTTGEADLFLPDLPRNADVIGLKRWVDSDHGDVWLAVRRGPVIVVLTATLAAAGADLRVQRDLTATGASMFEEMCRFDTTCGGPTPPAPVVLGPRGIGALRLGMNGDQVNATGEATARQGSEHDGWRPGCLILTLNHESNGYDGRVSADQGLEQIRATPSMRTPGGIGIGSSRAALAAAYPRHASRPGADAYTIPTGRGSVYRIHLDGDAVISLDLELPDPDCSI
jgi:hypothetical protein